MVDKSTKSERTLSAVMFAELSNISNAILRDDAKFTRILSKFNSIVKACCSKFSGKIVKKFNTGTLVEFSDALNCVLCAIDIQQKLGSYNETTDDSNWILSRIGLHYHLDKKAKINLLGHHVDIAVAIKDLAPLGGFCITQDIAQQVKSKLDLDLTYIGPGNIKDLPADIELYTAQPSSDWYTRNVDRLRSEIAEIEKNQASKKFQKSAAANLDEVCEELIFEDDDEEFAVLTPIDDELETKPKPAEIETLDEANIIEDDELIFEDDDEIVDSSILEPIPSQEEISEKSAVEANPETKPIAEISADSSNSDQPASALPEEANQQPVSPITNTGNTMPQVQQATPIAQPMQVSPWGKDFDPRPVSGGTISAQPTWAANGVAAPNANQPFPNQNLPGSVPPNPLGSMYNIHQVQAAKEQEKHNETHFLRTLITILILGVAVYFAYPYIITDNTKPAGPKNPKADQTNSATLNNNGGSTNTNEDTEIAANKLGLNPKESLTGEIKGIKENWKTILFDANPKKRTFAGKWHLTTMLIPTEIKSSRGAIIAAPAKLYKSYQASIFLKLTGEASIIFPVRYRKCMLTFSGKQFSFTGINNHTITGENPVNMSQKPVEVLITVLAKDGEKAIVQIQINDKIIFAFAANPDDFTTSPELKLLKLPTTKSFYFSSKTTQFMVTDIRVRNFVRKGNKLEAAPTK